MSTLSFESANSVPVVPPPSAQPVTDDQLAHIKEGVGRIVPIPWPSYPKQWVGMRCLSRAETREAHREAKGMAERFGQKDDQEFISKCHTDIVLSKAIRDCVWIETDDGLLSPIRFNPGQQLLLTADRFAEVTTDEQVKRLVAHYEAISAESVPLTRFQQQIQNEEFHKAWAELKKKPEVSHLIGCASSEALALLSFIAHLYQEPPASSGT